MTHAKNYCDFIVHKLKLTSNSLVIEVASNDGYLLKNFVSANIPCIGIEPTDSTATAAEKLGIPVIREFFGANYAGIKPDLLRFVCDALPSKQNKYLPGSHIPILPPTALQACKPDFVLILPWNIANEIMTQHGYVRDWNGKFVIAVPKLVILT